MDRRESYKRLKERWGEVGEREKRDYEGEEERLRESLDRVE
jgi:hypothetical protein